MSKTQCLLLAVAVAAMALTLSCSGDDGGNGDGDSSSSGTQGGGVSSSSLGGDLGGNSSSSSGDDPSSSSVEVSSSSGDDPSSSSVEVSSSSGDDPSGGGLSLPAGNPNGIPFVEERWDSERGNYFEKTGEPPYTGNSPISFVVWYYIDDGDSWEADTITLGDSKIQGGQVASLNLPAKEKISKYLRKIEFNDEAAVTVRFITPDVYLFSEGQLVVDIPGRNDCILKSYTVNASQQITGEPYFIYFSKPGRIDVTETYEDGIWSQVFISDFDFKEGWNTVYFTIVSTETQYLGTATTTLPAGATLEWGLRCYDY